jgi:general secretion pathway protein D
VDLVTNTRSIKTSIIVDDGQVVVLGGLIRDDLTESESKVPLLGDIPVLGWLFTRKATTKQKINLMVFLHPTILRDPELAARLTNEKYNFIRDKQLEVRKKGLLLMPDEETPMMPPLDEYLAQPPYLAVLPRPTGTEPPTTQGAPVPAP